MSNSDLKPVYVLDCPHNGIHTGEAGYLEAVHPDGTGSINLGFDKICIANAWSLTKQPTPALTAKAITPAPTKVTKAGSGKAPDRPKLLISGRPGDRYTVDYSGLHPTARILADEVTLQELEMVLNAIQMLQASQ